MPDYLIFTDLDGTLLGHDTYTYTENLELIRQLKRRYPIILCSSKTALEIKDLQKISFSGYAICCRKRGIYIF